MSASSFNLWSAGMRIYSFLTIAIVSALLSACQPTVKVEAPDKPIVINLNVKIEQEVRIKVDREVEDLMKTQPDLF